MLIDRCNCHERPFEEVLEIARTHECTDDLERALDLAECGANCSVCHAFIRCCLATGQTEFDEFPVQYLE